jgi:hypothetical protein
MKAANTTTPTQSQGCFDRYATFSAGKRAPTLG